MTKYQAYAEYKDSGVEWFQKIPINWNAVPLKYMCKGFVKDGPHETPKFIDSGIPFLSVDGIQNCKLIFDGCRYISQEDHERYSLKCKPVKGDILLGKAASVGKVAYVDTNIEFNVWSPLAVITPKNNNLGKFIYYCIQSGELQIQCEIFSNSNTQKNLGMNTIDNLDFPYPSEFEAIKIINFLDHETAKIDHLIEKQQQLIELLKEKRQAVISHAVTKGLDPNVPMKDSGVEWLREVPEHWIVSKLKYIKSHGHNAFVDGPFGSNLKSEHFVEDGDVYVIESNFATTGNLEPSNLKKITTKHFETICRSEAKGGDIIIAKIGARFGSSSILPILDKKAVVSGNSLKLTVNCKICDVNYANKLLQHLKNEGAIDDGVNGSAQPALSLGGLNTLPFLLPPLDEQIKIIQSLDLKVSKIDQVISQAKKQILLMQERRTALISAAVTGKIDVRNWQAPTVTEADTELSA